MKFITYRRLMAITALGLAAGSAFAADMSFTGSLAIDDGFQFIKFTTGGGTVTLETVSYGGGTTVDGTPVPAGGFDPFLTVLDETGKILYQNDDKVTIADNPLAPEVDSYLNMVLNSGTYWLAVTQSWNTVNGASNNHYDPSQGNNGFNESGSFTSAYGCSNGQFCDYLADNRSGNWALNLLNVDTAQLENGFTPPAPPPLPTLVPEPGSLVLVGLGLIGLLRRRQRPS